MSVVVRWAGRALLGALLLTSLTVAPTRAGWDAASIGNSVDTVASGSPSLRHAYGSTTCAAAVRTSGATACAGSPAPDDAITNVGNLAGAQLASDYSAASCAPVQMADRAVVADPLLPRYDVSFEQPDPWGGTDAIALAGAKSYVADVQATPTAVLTTYSVGIWFRVPAGQTGGGGLLSLDASSYDAPSAAGSPMLWIDVAGHVRYRVSGALGGASSGATTGAYNDGAWHLAVLSFGTLSGTLYVDDLAVAGSAAVQLAASGGYWHVGWADPTGVTNPPPTPYFRGSLAGAFVRGGTLTAGQVAGLRASTSSDDFAARVQALGSVRHLWLLDDPGTTTYTGPLPVVGTTSPCTMLDLSWTLTSPTATVASAVRLSSFADGTWHAVPAPGAGQTQHATITTTRNGSYDPSVAGLRLHTPLAHRVRTLPAPNAWTSTLSWTDAAMVFVP